jgi:ribosomal protein L7Ae-like RNA K-turn-binding protein
MKSESQVLFALGMAQKAGKIASGDVAVKTALKKGKARLLLIAEDTSENSKKELINLASQMGVKVVEGLNKLNIGWAIGKAKRSSIVVLDKNFVKMILKE